MNPYLSLVQKYNSLLGEGRTYPLGGFPPLEQPALSDDAPVVLVFSPHPDDECITGAVTLRLRREHGCRVVNVAVTQGSNRERQAARLAELEAACTYLGYENVQTAENGFEQVNLKSRENDPTAWQEKVACIAWIIKEYSPRVIIIPHIEDWNSTHIGTHYLVMDALSMLEENFNGTVVETEFWAAMDTPNVMIESSIEDVARMVTATSFHAGEVERNPYHLSLPAWMIDNVRRGSELVGGQGGEAPDYSFATLYRVSRYTDGTLEPVFAEGRCYGKEADLAGILDLQP
jgi:LmbE family N-acetylglucosaminyl deacetylase